jgi:ribonuclease P protein component
MGPRDARAASQEGAQASHGPTSVQAPERLTSERYPSRVRLGRGADLVRCWESGRRVRMRRLDVAWRPNSQGHARAGIVVPRFGETAVARNRLRRRVREILRRELLHTLPAVDVVVRAKHGAYTARLAELRVELADAADRMLR